ncbi:MAG: tripartite tricarboxylate transporter TctB family protein [Clostridiales bacterium]|nr:tripartite tricarboxylate transporter TctB family protein [Clostridiales bacterium]
MKSKKWDLLICIVLAALLMIFVLDLPNTNPMARVYPMVVLGGSYLMIAITIVKWFIAKKRGEIEGGEGMDTKRIVYIAVYCLSILVYILLIQKLGFIVSTIAFGIYSLIYLKNKNKILIVVLPIVVTVVLYYIFTNFLFVTLPSGLLM